MDFLKINAENNRWSACSDDQQGCQQCSQAVRLCVHSPHLTWQDLTSSMCHYEAPFLCCTIVTFNSRPADHLIQNHQITAKWRSKWNHSLPSIPKIRFGKNKKVMQCHAFTACRSIPNALCQVAVCGQSENIGARLHVPTPWIEAAFAVEFIRAVSYCWWHRLGRWAQTLPWVIRPTQLPGLCGFLQDAAHELSQW